MQAVTVLRRKRAALLYRLMFAAVQRKLPHGKHLHKGSLMSLDPDGSAQATLMFAVSGVQTLFVDQMGTKSFILFCIGVLTAAASTESS